MFIKTKEKKKPSLSGHSEEGNNMGTPPINRVYSISHDFGKIKRETFDIGLLLKAIYYIFLYPLLFPAHDGRTHSLSVKITGNRVLLYCFAGCQPDEIMNFLRLPISALFFNGAQNLSHRKNRYERRTNLLAFFNSCGRKVVNGIKRVHFNFPAVISTNSPYSTEGRSPPTLIQVSRQTLF